MVVRGYHKGGNGWLERGERAAKGDDRVHINGIRFGHILCSVNLSLEGCVKLAKARMRTIATSWK